MLPTTDYTCPLDGKDLAQGGGSTVRLGGRVVSATPALVLRLLCGDIPVLCTNKDQGCDWSGPRDALEAHLGECESGESEESTSKPEDGCRNREFGCDWEPQDGVNEEEHLKLCRFAKIAQKFAAQEEQSREMQRRLVMVQNSMPVTGQSELFVKQLIVDHAALEQEVGYLRAAVANLQLQMNHITMSYKAQLYSERQRMHLVRMSEVDEDMGKVKL